MSSVLHPVGPEPPQTYWVRRAVIFGAAILALIVLIAVIVSQNSSGSVVAEPTATAPAPSASISGPPPYTPTPSSTPTSSSTPTATSSAAAKQTEESAKPKATAKESAKPKATAKPTESAKPKESTKPKTAPKPVGPLSCPAGELRPTLTGDQQLERKEKNTFAISLINGSGKTCTIKVDQDSFELKIYSGKDRIWSSKDCSTAVKPLSKKLAAEQAVEWKMVWDGRRSKDDCKQRPEIPRPGTYFATAQLDGAKPVQLRMIIHT